MPWEIICRCKCLPPSNGTGRDRFLSVPSHMQELLLHTFEQSDLFAGQILTIVRTCNGLLIYTEDKKQLLSLLNRLINQQ